MLQEDDYRNDMMTKFDSRYWIAPSLSASRSFLEPLQCGGVRTMGIHKPWSPSRSYGLVVELDHNFGPSRAITAAPTARATASPARSSMTARSSPRREAAMPFCGSRRKRGKPEMTSLIEMQKVTKAYRGVPALRDVDFDLEKGEIHALLGENGAGKSTLTKIMAGVVEATSGKMLYRGKEVTYATPFEALSDGIAMVFQETSLVPSMTVAQNIYLGKEKFLNRLRGIYISAQQFLQSLNFTVDPTAIVATSAPPSGRWSRSPAPSITRPR